MLTSPVVLCRIVLNYHTVAQHGAETLKSPFRLNAMRGGGTLHVWWGWGALDNVEVRVLGIPFLVHSSSSDKF